MLPSVVSFASSGSMGMTTGSDPCGMLPLSDAMRAAAWMVMASGPLTDAWWSVCCTGRGVAVRCAAVFVGCGAPVVTFRVLPAGWITDCSSVVPWRTVFVVDAMVGPAPWGRALCPSALFAAGAGPGTVPSAVLEEVPLSMRSTAAPRGRRRSMANQAGCRRRRGRCGRRRCMSSQSAGSKAKLRSSSLRRARSSNSVWSLMMQAVFRGHRPLRPVLSAGWRVRWPRAISRCPH